MLQVAIGDDRLARALRRRRVDSASPRMAGIGALAGASAYPAITIGDELMALALGIARGWRLIALTTAIALLAGIAFLLTVTPLYESVAQILIDPRAKRIMEGAVLEQGLGSSALGADTLLVDSQVEIISSRPVLERVVAAEGLESDAELYRPRSGSLRATARNWLGGFIPGFVPEPSIAAPAADVVIEQLRQSHLWVNRSGNTYLVDVAMVSEDAEKSARIANAIVKSYLETINSVTSDATRETTLSLESRIAEQRDEVRKAEAQVERYKAEAGLIGSPGLLVDEQQLRDLNGRLVLARSQTAAAQARLEQLKAVAGKRIDIGATAVALQSPVIASLRAQLGAVAQREAQLAMTLGRKHPDLVLVHAERRGLEAQIGAELERIRDSAQNELRLAQANQTMLENELDGLKSRADENNRALVRLRELEREAQAARAVFEAYLVRARQTSEQEKLDTNNTRIVSLATVPQRPIFPRTPIVLAAALLGGLGLGTLLVWLKFMLAGAKRGPLPRC